MKAAAKSLSRRRSKKPLTFSAIDRWLSALNMSGWETRARFDSRFLTISPAFEGIIEHLRGFASGQPDERRQQQIVGIANLAIGTYDGPRYRRRDAIRALIVVDWMARFALPLYLERLPDRMRQRDVATLLRGSQPTLWAAQLIDALNIATRAWCAVDDWRRSDGTTGEERRVLTGIVERLDTTMVVLADAVANAVHGATRQGGGNDTSEAWLCRRALDAVHGNEVVSPDSFNQLVAVLRAVDAGDGRSAVASRCRWTEPARKHAGSVSPSDSGSGQVHSLAAGGTR